MSAHGFTPAEATSRRYATYLIVIALAGWALASYDFNLLVLTIPDISRELGLSGGQIGVMGFVIYVAEFIVALFAGRGMDAKGRKWMWMICLGAAAIFTGLTFFVQNFWQLVAIRALASSFANAELAISITLVNEQLSARRRGLLYSVVQGGWPLGVFLASGVYLAVSGLGWRWVFAFGVIPLVVVIIGRRWIREPERFTHLVAVRRALARGDQAEVDRLVAERPVDVAELEKGSVRAMFATPGTVRRNLITLSITWILYAIAFVATNVYITYWFTEYAGWSAGAVATLLLVCGGIGFFFYIIGGYFGERFGRRTVLMVTGLVTGPLNLALLLFHQNTAATAIIFFLCYQASNGTWSGAGYSYWAECFPTRVRGTAIGWLTAMFVLGQALGSLIWSGILATSTLVVAWMVMAVGVAFAQGLSTLLLPRIEPGQELERLSV